MFLFFQTKNTPPPGGDTGDGQTILTTYAQNHSDHILTKSFSLKLRFGSGCLHTKELV